MFDEAVSMITEEDRGNAPIILSSENWHQGVAGIVASRLTERYRRPAVVICLKDGVGRGSCRSFGAYPLFPVLNENRELLMSFGGHEMAAGLTLKEENIPALKRALCQKAEDMPPEEAPPVLIDAQVKKPRLLTTENVKALSLLEPYGPGNPAPVLCMIGAEVKSVMTICGGKHTKLWLMYMGHVFEGIFFSKPGMSCP